MSHQKAKINEKGIVFYGTAAERVFGFNWRDENTTDPFSLNSKSKFFEWSHPTLEGVIYRKLYDFYSHQREDIYSMDCMYKELTTVQDIYKKKGNEEPENGISESLRESDGPLIMYAPYVICFVQSSKPTKVMMKEVCSVFKNRPKSSSSNSLGCLTNSYFIVDHSKLFKSKDKEIGKKLIRTSKQYRTKLGLHELKGMWNQLCYELFDSKEDLLTDWRLGKCRRMMLIFEGISCIISFLRMFRSQSFHSIMRYSFPLALVKFGENEFVLLFGVHRAQHELALELVKEDPLVKSSVVIWISSNKDSALVDHSTIDKSEDVGSAFKQFTAYSEEDFWKYTEINPDLVSWNIRGAVSDIYTKRDDGFGGEDLEEVIKLALTYKPHDNEETEHPALARVFKNSEVDPMEDDRKKRKRQNEKLGEDDEEEDGGLQEGETERNDSRQTKKSKLQTRIIEEAYKDKEMLPCDLVTEENSEAFEKMVKVFLKKTTFVEKYSEDDSLLDGNISYWLIECDSPENCSVYWDGSTMDIETKDCAKLCVKMCMNPITTKVKATEPINPYESYPEEILARIFKLSHRENDLCFCLHQKE